MYVLARLIGVAFGIIVGLIICLIAFKKMNSDGKLKTEYDERQSEIRGKGYQYGFWAEAIYFALLMLLDISEIKIPAENTVIFFGGIVFGVVVLYTYCIWNGAYFGLNNNQKQWTYFLSFFGLFNLAIGIMAYVRGYLVVDGVLTTSFVNVLCAVMMLLAVAIQSIKNMIDSKENMADEES